MDVLGQKTSIVSKLRVKGERLDRVGARLHFERLFGADNFLPDGLPPKTIVCIKHLRDPSPRTLRLNHFDLRGSDAWRRAVAREIEKFYRRAFRPIRETVPAQAESVVFTDSSELLASLARDWHEGLLAENWWWRSLFPNLHLTGTIARIWMDAAEFAPFALQILAKQGNAASFVGKLQPDETSGLLRQITTIFGLNKLQKILLEPIEERKFAALSEKTTIEKKAEDFFFLPVQIPAPWLEFVPETRHSALNFEQQSLLGIGLMLARAPRVVRSSEFAREVKTFRLEFETNRAAQNKSEIPKELSKKEKKPSRAQKKSSAEKPEPALVLAEDESKTRKSPEKKRIKFLADSSDAQEKSSETSDFSTDSKSKDFFTAENVKAKTKETISDNSPPEQKSGERESEKETKSSQPKKRKLPPVSAQKTVEKAENESVEEAETDFEFVVETRFGGVFYLLNLGLFLNLYRDFTESGDAEIDLNVWDFVALLSLEFIGREIKKDAVWKLLEWLAGRENDEELGQDFTAPDAWRISKDWLETFQTGEKWLWSAAGKRLVVRHPAGFNVIDVPLKKDAETQLKNELEVYLKDFSELVKSDSKKIPKRLSRAENWLKNLSEYMQARLFQALNVETREEIRRILFERRARASVTATHLDVTFGLADLPLEVRLSGLDRNPSWIPAVGRFVSFHFV